MITQAISSKEFDPYKMAHTHTLVPDEVKLNKYQVLKVLKKKFYLNSFKQVSPIKS